MTAATQTYDNKGGQNAEGAFASGTITWPGSSLAEEKVYCGFQPNLIILIHSGSADYMAIWHKGMTAAYYLKLISHDTAQVAMQTSGGPEVLADTTGYGFTVPAALGTASEVTYWVAFR